MFRFLGLAAVSAIALMSSANAADMYRAPDAVGGYKDVPMPYVSWSGFYAGVNGGYGWSDQLTKVSYYNPALTDTGSVSILKPEGGFGGGQLGYNWQGVWHPHLVLGIEADIQGSDIKNSGSGTAFTLGDHRTYGASTNVDWFGTVRGRLGYAFETTLVYATGGLAYGDVKLNGSYLDSNTYHGNVSHSATETGFVLGGGVEHKLTPAWSVKAEYQYIDLGSISAVGPLLPPAGSYSLKAFEDIRFSTVRLGLNYHIGSGYEPLK
jgi:outer membrane immunogenic protein